MQTEKCATPYCNQPAELNRVRCARCLEYRRAVNARHRASARVEVGGKPGRPRKANAKPQSVRARRHYERRIAAQGGGNWAEKLTTRLESLGYSPELGKTWTNALERRYREHVAACRSLGCNENLESFETFVREIVEAPSDAVRLSILAPDEPLAEYQPFQSYEQYVSPIAA